VTYQSEGFLKKNRDTVLEDQMNMIKNVHNKLVRKLFSDEPEGKKQNVPTPKVRVSVTKLTVPSSTTSTSKQHKKTGGSQFWDFNMLMVMLYATMPHYV